MLSSRLRLLLSYHVAAETVFGTLVEIVESLGDLQPKNSELAYVLD